MHNYLDKVPAIRRLHASRLTENLGAFARAAFPVVFPNRKLIWSLAYDYLAEVLMLMARRDPNHKRVIWNQPPRTLKSFLASIAFPVWLWLHDPSHQFVCVSYSMDLSTELSLARRNLICSAWFQCLFGDRFQLASNRKDQFSNNQRGTMFATSAGARLMGFGFDTCIADDLTSPDMALSDSERTAANNWFDHTLRQRANDPASSAILVISQRTHELDVPGYLIETDEGTWTHIKIPLVAEEPTTYTFPRSGQVWNRPAGDVLMPKRFTQNVIAELKKRRMVFAGQYQQEPVSFEGNLIRRSDVKFFGGLDPATGIRDEARPESFDLVLVSVDCAFKAESHHDKVALLAIGIKGRKRYILEARNRNIDVLDTEDEIRRLRQKHQASVVLVEDKANGPAVITRLKQSFPGIIPVNPQGGKESRMYAASAEWQAGDWYVARGGGWVEEFIQQIIHFPRGRWDDLADAMSQASIWLQQHAQGAQLVPFERVERAGPLAWLRGVLAERPPAPVAQTQFWQPRPVLPVATRELDAEEAQAANDVVEGRGDTVAAIEKLMWGSIKDFME